MAGKFAIFRMTNSTDTEDSITEDKIEFDSGAQVPDARSGIISFTPVMSRTQTENPAPFLQVARRPDTGFSGMRYTINVLFDETGGTAGGIAKLRDWMSEDNFVRATFNEGRFGIRNDYRPEFNIKPDNTAGYKLVHFETSQELLHHKIVKAVIILEFSGAAERLGET